MSETLGGTWTGIMLLLLFLVFDSFTGQWQSKMFQQNQVCSTVCFLFIYLFRIFLLLVRVHAPVQSSVRFRRARPASFCAPPPTRPSSVLCSFRFTRLRCPVGGRCVRGGRHQVHHKKSRNTT